MSFELSENERAFFLALLDRRIEVARAQVAQAENAVKLAAMNLEYLEGMRADLGAGQKPQPPKPSRAGLVPLDLHQLTKGGKG